MQELLETDSQAQEIAVSSERMETDVTETEKQSNDVEVQACTSNCLKLMSIMISQ